MKKCNRTHGFWEGDAADGPLEVADAQHVQRLQAHRVPDPNVRLETAIWRRFRKPKNFYLIKKRMFTYFDRGRSITEWQTSFLFNRIVFYLTSKSVLMFT